MNSFLLKPCQNMQNCNKCQIDLSICVISLDISELGQNHHQDQMPGTLTILFTKYCSHSSLMCGKNLDGEDKNKENNIALILRLSLIMLSNSIDILCIDWWRPQNIRIEYEPLHFLFWTRSIITLALLHILSYQVQSRQPMNLIILGL